MKRKFWENRNGMFSSSKKAKTDFDDNAIRHYTEEHGFGTKTPSLSQTLSAEVFKQHYYEKKELMEFCRSVSIPTSGLKNDLNDRIELYLRTGRITMVQPKKSLTKPDTEPGLALGKVVVNYKSDPATRGFFENYIPAFTGFSALVQKQIRQRLADSEEFTYEDIIDMHKNFLKDKKAAKKTGEATKVAHNSCQYNQFFIDYSHDASRKVHSAKDAWMLVRNSAGEKTYQRYKEKIEEIRGILRAQEESNTFAV